MKYVSLPNLDQNKIVQILFDSNSTKEKRRTAILSAVRHSDPHWAFELLLRVMQTDDWDTAYAGFSLIDMTIQMGDLQPDLNPLYNWANKYLAIHPEHSVDIGDYFSLIPHSEWNKTNQG